MAEVRLVDPHKLRRNPENPRLIFRQDELNELQNNIAEQGILVPLTVYGDRNQLFLLDGERRWRCALRLGLSRVPVIVQPKPNRMQNIMLMFSIHKTRRDWDPLPTALKLKDLEDEFERRNKRKPTEAQLAGLASLTRGEVRRLKVLLQLPDRYRTELLAELEKPRAKQEISVDHVLEATKSAEALRKRAVIDEEEEDKLRLAILDKFRRKIIKNTVAPRKLARLARAVGRSEVSNETARRAVTQLLNDPQFSIDDAFRISVEQVDFEHNLEQLAVRVISRLDELEERGYAISQTLATTLRQLYERIRSIVRA